ncbi:acetyl-CoA hydrolase/transferase family protein [Hydrogenophaga palleronii]|uniref:acetyl-CoA hydrolase/transferase family protein n=1 Tax=Hydrogenophaga palleronii TaxID=65655 RepID=UPI000A04D5C5|nr:acetyl-CoA hydrolase/transferase C-terminal domain-containing protein [Hydrogenophaga palleronii]
MWGQATAEPLTLTRALVAQRAALGRLRVFVGIGVAPTLEPAHADGFDFIGYSAAGSHRALAEEGLLDILPVHYSQLPDLMRRRVLPVDVLLLQVSAPDKDGRHSLGYATEYLLAAMATARVVIVEVNADVPWTHGECSLGPRDADLFVKARFAPAQQEVLRTGAVEQAIARHVAGLVEDGATLQMGIGAVPDAVAGALRGHRDLGLHTGAAGDGVAGLALSGVLTNARKTRDQGVSVAGLLLGGAAVREWAHDNRKLCMRGTDYTHHPDVLASIDKLVAINSAIEVDLSGQVNAEVANECYIGAVGGAADFLRGAARSRGGVPIIALPSTTARGRSRIVPALCGPVSTSRSDVGFVVTEHGIADLRGQSLSNRVRRLVEVAAPTYREGLLHEAHYAFRRAGAPLN